MLLFGSKSIKGSTLPVEIFFEDGMDLTNPILADTISSMAKDEVFRTALNALAKKWFMIITNIDPINGTKEDKREYDISRIKLEALSELRTFMEDVGIKYGKQNERDEKDGTY